MKNRYFEARKQVHKQKDADYETIVWHVIKAEVNVDQIEELFNDIYDDDWENAYHMGFSFDENGELYALIVDKVIDELEERIELDSYNEYPIEQYKEIINQLNKYQKYTLYLIEED